MVRERLGAVEVLRLDRPARRNAMDTALLGDLLAALDDCADAHAVVVSTTDVAALSAGADVGEALDPAEGVARMELFTRIYAAIEALPVPTIAVCVGNCVGAGAELAAGCDLRVGGDNLKLAWAGARHGVPVGPARLAPLIGVSRAKDWVLTGRVIGAEEALAAGFLHAAVPAADAEARAVELASGLGDVRVLKGMFADLDETADRVGYENQRLMEFQRTGAGLPRKT
ncbi:MAG: enoyl-CoA hydratase/isomerase family protein [Solirubrobacteraceae bacterium]